MFPSHRDKVNVKRSSWSAAKPGTTTSWTWPQPIPPWTSTSFRTSPLSSTWDPPAWSLAVAWLQVSSEHLSSPAVCRCGVPLLFGQGYAGLPVSTAAGPAELELGAAAAPGGRVGAGPEPRPRHPHAGEPQHLRHAPPVPLSAPRRGPGVCVLHRCM